MNRTSSSVFNRYHTPADLADVSARQNLRTAVSHSFQTPFSFSSLVFSVQGNVSGGGSFLLEAQVCVAETWSDFYPLGYFSAEENKSFPLREDAFCRVAVDELILTRPAQAYRFRIQTAGPAVWHKVSVCGIGETFDYKQTQAARLPAGFFMHRVEPISQKEYPSPDKNRICSPTSLCMALHALGTPVSLPQVIKGVYDPTANIYGNWVINTFYAAQQGLDAYVRRFSALTELEEFCTEKSLVIASVAYEKQALPGAPQPQTPGHLVLIRGWQNGKILVADPAAPTAAEVLRSYDAQAFARAWLKNKQGAAYIVRKP